MIVNVSFDTPAFYLGVIKVYFRTVKVNFRWGKDNVKCKVEETIYNRL